MGSTAILDSATGVCCKLQQEKDVTVRWLRCMPIMRVSSLWRMQLGEVMDQVWTRDRQEREECQKGSTRTETRALDAHDFPP
jgi:hypothetical protein